MEKLIETSANVLGVPLTAVIVTALGMVAVYLLIQNKRKKSRSEIDTNLSETERQIVENDKKIAILAQRVNQVEKRLEEGSARFDAMDVSLRNINSSIERLTGMVEMFFRSQGLGGGK